MLGPITVVSCGRISWREKGAVAAMLGGEKGNVRVGGDRASRLGSDSDEGVILRVQNQRGNRDAVQHAGSAGTRVIVIRRTESTVERSNALIEFAQGSDVLRAV